jgi:peptide/nickel transport system substrate-binding protein
MRRALRRHGTLSLLPLRRLMPERRLRRQAVAACGGLLAVGLVTAGCGAAGANPGGDTPVGGGTVTYALQPNQTPDYIFPFTNGNAFTVVNTDTFQYLMYRPLYWFGDRALPYLNDKYSLADPPVYHGQTVTFKLKKYMWSNGTPVTAQDVLFWVHMQQAVGAADWGGFVPHEFPTNISSIQAIGQDKIKMQIVGRYSRLWFTDNELSQITPMPLYWDRTSATATSNCAQVVSDCAAVYNYLNGQSKNPGTWPSSPLWSIVDGPWKLVTFSAQQGLTYKFNTSYSGPVAKHHVRTFIERPFTSEEAEYNVLQAGGSNGLDVGYMPTVDAPVPPPGAQLGTNPVGGYNLQAVYVWGLSYFPYNFSSADPQQAVVSQLYIRQAIQLLENQAAVIQGPLHGYGKVTAGPVGGYPPTKYLSPLAKRGDPYPYDPLQARTMLADHGWTLNPHGTLVCTDPGSGARQCGRGITRGTPLTLDLYYSTGTSWLESAVLQLKSNASQVGINIQTTGQPFNQVIAEVTGQACSSGKCPWEMADWGLGWSYSPDFMPTGDELFQTGAAANLGQYTNPHNDYLIEQTLHNYSNADMWKWENYLTTQLPVGLQPNGVSALVESIGSLHIGTQSSTLSINPEEWYYVR